MGSSGLSVRRPMDAGGNGPRLRGEDAFSAWGLPAGRGRKRPGLTPGPSRRIGTDRGARVARQQSPILRAGNDIVSGSSARHKACRLGLGAASFDVLPPAGRKATNAIASARATSPGGTVGRRARLFRMSRYFTLMSVPAVCLVWPSAPTIHLKSTRRRADGQGYPVRNARAEIAAGRPDRPGSRRDDADQRAPRSGRGGRP